MTAQEELIVRRTKEYARDVAKELELNEEQERAIQAAYLSGVMGCAQALAMNDGVSISKFAEAARNAGEALLGIKSEPWRKG